MIVGSVSPAATVHAGLPAQVVIIDDSVVARTVLARMIEATGRFQVAGSFSDVRAGLAYLHDHAVDVVLLDIAMPGIDGITALPDVIAAGRGAKVLIVSSSADEGAAVGFRLAVARTTGGVGHEVRENNIRLAGAALAALRTKGWRQGRARTRGR